MIDGTPLLRTLFEKWLQTQVIFIQRLSTKMRTTAEIHGVRCGVRPSAHDGSNSQVRKPDGTDAIHFHRARCSVLPTPSIVPGLCGPGAVETTRCPLPMPQPAATDIYARALSTSSTLSEESGGGGLSISGSATETGYGQNAVADQAGGIRLTRFPLQSSRADFYFPPKYLEGRNF
jgi:hypothetical protein